MPDNNELFLWHTYDVSSRLPAGWQDEILAVTSSARRRELVPTSVTSREATADLRIVTHTVGGVAVASLLPWLRDLYHGLFRDLAQQVLPDEKVLTAGDPRYGVNINVQHGAGGVLTVANAGDVRGQAAVDADPTRIWPLAGQLVFFDARRNTHYVTGDQRYELHVDSNPLQGMLYVTSHLPGREHEHGIRAAAAMNFYTPSCPEAARPADLNRHLFGTG